MKCFTAKVNKACFKAGRLVLLVVGNSENISEHEIRNGKILKLTTTFEHMDAMPFQFFSVLRVSFPW